MCLITLIKWLKAHSSALHNTSRLGAFLFSHKRIPSHKLACLGFSTCEVKLADGESIKVYYDELTSISQCIAQEIARGLVPPTRPFQLFRRGADRDEMLDRKGSLSFAPAEKKRGAFDEDWSVQFRKSFEEYHGNLLTSDMLTFSASSSIWKDTIKYLQK